jgi:hypothetical protein
MQNFQVFLVKVCQDCVEVRNRDGFGILGAIAIARFPNDPAGVQTPDGLRDCSIELIVGI